MLEVINLKSYIEDTKTRQTKRIVDGVSFRVEKGGTLGIFGESGSGKSFTAFSIMDVLGGYPGIVGGEIWFESDSKRENLLEGISDICEIIPRDDEIYVKKDIRKWNKKYNHDKRMKEIRGKKIALAPQGAKTALWPFGTIEDQIFEAFLRGDNDRNSANTIVPEILCMLQLERDGKKYPHELSGGACQRAMLSIVIALNPNLLIADEFTTGLDPVLQLELIRIMSDFNQNRLKSLKLKEKDHALIVISHDLKIMQMLADNLVIIQEGKIVEEGSKELLTGKLKPQHPYTQRLFKDADIEQYMSERSYIK